MSDRINRPTVYLRPLIHGKNNQTFSDLKFLYEHSDKRYKRCDDPDKADIILIALPGNKMPFHVYAKSFLKLKLPAKHLDKAFAISLHRDKHVYLLRGIYESAGKYGLGRSDRIRSGAYSERAFNSLIAELPAFNQKDSSQNKTFQFSFIGRNCHPVRDAIYKLKPTRSDVLIKDSSDFNVWSETRSEDFDKRLQYYTDVIQSSKFSLCPRGFGASSIRLFESMKMGVCPVIITDEWKPPKGPDWNKCAIIIKESQVKNIEQIITEREEEFLELGTRAAQEYNRFFSNRTYFNWIVENCSDIKDTQKIPERIWWKLRYVHYALFIYYNGVKKNFRKVKRIVSLTDRLSKTMLNFYPLFLLYLN